MRPGIKTPQFPNMGVLFQKTVRTSANKAGVSQILIL